MKKHIEIQGARENNLQNVDIEIPRDQLVVVTGVSGSGKSSLAFDTVYAEGQRRLMASMSSLMPLTSTKKCFMCFCILATSKSPAASFDSLSESEYLF